MYSCTSKINAKTTSDKSKTKGEEKSDKNKPKTN